MQARRVHAVPHIAKRGGWQVFATHGAGNAQQGALGKWHAVQRMVKHDADLEGGVVSGFGQDVGHTFAARERLVQPPVPLQSARVDIGQVVHPGAIRSAGADPQRPLALHLGQFKARGRDVGLGFGEAHKPPWAGRGPFEWNQWRKALRHSRHGNEGPSQRQQGMSGLQKQFHPRRQSWYFFTQASNFCGAWARFHSPAANLLASDIVG